jgi:[ribosomal protein S18]-alanine N-acetyltransferase
VSVVVVEPAKETDIDAIDEIEQHSFKSPWPRDTFKAELLREWARLDVGRIDGRLVGFCNYWLVTTELHILAIATHPDLRRRGIGRQLLEHVLGVARAAGCSLATLEVRRSNVPAIALYEHAGFKIVHVRTRYYQDDDEDALVMLRGLTED